MDIVTSFIRVLLKIPKPIELKKELLQQFEIAIDLIIEIHVI